MLVVALAFMTPAGAIHVEEQPAGEPPTLLLALIFVLFCFGGWNEMDWRAILFGLLYRCWRLLRLLWRLLRLRHGSPFPRNEKSPPTLTTGKGIKRRRNALAGILLSHRGSDPEGRLYCHI